MKKSIIKTLSVMLAVVLTLTAAPLSGFVGLELPKWLDISIKSSAATSGTCGENLTWTFDESTGTLTISGTGAMDGYGYDDSPWAGKNIKTIIIEEGVTTIGYYAFGYSTTESVIISDSVITIEACAFVGCDSLINVTIPNNVTTIGNDAFSYCDYLTSVTLGNSVTTIGDSAFYFCRRLKEINIPDGVTIIGGGAFASCRALPSITFPNSLKVIGKSAFNDCISLDVVYIDDITNWFKINFENRYSNPMCCADNLLINNTIPSGHFILPAGVTIIPVGTFKNSNITGITIPNSVRTIDDLAFEHCNLLTSVTIPDSVTTIGSSAFYLCGKLTNITIPDSVTVIGDDAFRQCESLTNITIPDSVISIGSAAFVYTAYFEDETNWEDDVLYIDNFLVNVKYNISGTYDIKEGTKVIADSAFRQCESLSCVKIPDSVITIGNSAFNDCTSLTNVTIPNSVKTIGNNSFNDCTRLTGITIPDSVITIGDAAFFCCDSLTSIKIPNSVKTIGSSAFAYCNLLRNVVIGNGMPQPENIATVIEEYAFEYSGLESVTIGDNVTTIRGNAFNGCGSLTNITIGENVTSIRSISFDYDRSPFFYNEDNWENGVVYIGKYLFFADYNCTVKEYIIKSGTELIVEAAFVGYEELRSITIPDSISIIGDYAFNRCDSLKDVYYGGTEEQWNEISIGSDNEYLKNATIHFNSTGGGSSPETPESEMYKSEHVISDYVEKNKSYKSEYLNGCAVPMDGTNGNPEYLIPGQTENMIPQGMTYWEEKDWILISSYDKEKENPSVIFALDRETGAFVAQFNLMRKDENGDIVDWKPHAGGIGVSDNNLYITSGGGVAYFPLSDLNVAPGTVKDIVRAGSISLDELGDTNAAYVSVSNGILWAGNFYSTPRPIITDILEKVGAISENWTVPAANDCNSVILGYELSGSTSEKEWNNLKSIKNEADYRIAIDESVDCIQGVAFKKMSNNKYKMYLSQTTNASFSASITTCDITLDRTDITTFEDDFTYNKNLPGTENIVFIDNELYIVYESAALSNYEQFFNQAAWNEYFKDCTDVIWKVNDNDLIGVTNLDESWFENGSYSGYNHDLAQFCVDFCDVGYDNATDVNNLLLNAGFNKSKVNLNAARDEVNYILASREITVNGTTKNLVFVACIGSHKDQWYSNFDPWGIETNKYYAAGSEAETTHMGFANAREYVYGQLDEFTSDLNPDDTIILLTGHSRGAATANLLAAKLIDEQNTSDAMARNGNIYAYTFATPRPTTNKNVSDSKYDSIHNIVNPEDFVTKVMLEKWGYHRYGKTYTLPSDTNDYNYNAYIKPMQTYCKALTGYEYEPYPKGELATYKVIKKFGDNVENVDEFYNKEFYAIWTDTLGDMEKWTPFEFFKYTLLPVVSGKATASDYGKILNVIAGPGSFYRSILMYFLKSDVDVPTSFSLDEITGIFGKRFKEAHQIETYSAFLHTMTEEQLLDDDRKMYKNTVNCPVDVEIYDNATGELVGKIVNNVIDEDIEAKENSVVMYVNGDSKEFYLPGNGDYTVKLVGNDKGTMDYNIAEIDSDVGEVERVNFYDVQITDGEAFTVDGLNENEELSDVVLVEKDGSTTESTNTVEDFDDAMVEISVSIVGNGVATENLNAVLGDYVSLIATPDENNSFVGWYENDELISTEESYSFVAKESRSIVAVFEENISEHIHSYQAVVTTPTCTAEGYTTYTCFACGDSYEGDFVDALGHNYVNGTCTVCETKDPTYVEEPEYNYSFYIQSPSRTEIRNRDTMVLHAIIDGNVPEGSYIEWDMSEGNFSLGWDSDTDVYATAEDKGWDTITAILYDADGNELARDSVELYSKSGFFDKIGGFFRSLFGMTKTYYN